jgi:hypothetical protein
MMLPKSRSPPQRVEPTPPEPPAMKPPTVAVCVGRGMHAHFLPGMLPRRLRIEIGTDDTRPGTTALPGAISLISFISASDRTTPPG